MIPDYLIGRVTETPIGCWQWICTGAPSRRSMNGTQAARHVWERTHGVKIPKGLLALHTCDNSLCVNPYHVWIGTQAENVRDMYLKDRKRKLREWDAKYASMKPQFTSDLRGYFDAWEFARFRLLPPPVLRIASE